MDEEAASSYLRVFLQQRIESKTAYHTSLVRDSRHMVMVMVRIYALQVHTHHEAVHDVIEPLATIERAILAIVEDSSTVLASVGPRTRVPV